MDADAVLRRLGGYGTAWRLAHGVGAPYHWDELAISPFTGGLEYLRSLDELLHPPDHMPAPDQLAMRLVAVAAHANVEREPLGARLREIVGRLGGREALPACECRRCRVRRD